MRTHPSSVRNRVRRPAVAIGPCGEGEPLVLIHGLATTQQIWSLVTGPSPAHRRVVTLDLPGFGASAPAGAGFDLDVICDPLARALAPRALAVSPLRSISSATP